MFKLIIAIHVLVLVTIYADESTVSYNQPKLCPYAEWNAIATTFANIIETKPHGIFINRKNNVYIAALGKQQIIIWLNGSQTESLILNVGHNPYSVFVTKSDDIYVETGGKRVGKWKLNQSNLTWENIFSDRCFGLFVDLNDSLYCSIESQHVVEKIPLNNLTNASKILVAGNYSVGSSSDMLNKPHGIFIDINFNLYVADCGNNRIQRFELGQKTGTTVVNNILNCPTGVILDSDNNLYIVDHFNRIVRSRESIFECLVGCTNEPGSTSSTLDNPFSLAFDSYGNIFVTDVKNNRIQKFTLISNSCNGTDPNNRTSIIETFNQTAISYHLPNFCSFPSWNPDGITFANETIIGHFPYGIFIDSNNTVYILGEHSGKVTIWSLETNSLIRTLSGNFSSPHSIFVTLNGDIYVDNGAKGEVVMWKSNETNSCSVMNVNGSCFGLFVDLKNNLYCSIKDSHQIVKKSIDKKSSVPEIIAGQGASRSMNNSLKSPRGIFIDSNFDLYVADGDNHRIICIYTNPYTDKIVAGADAPKTIILNHPTGVTLDANHYLYIVDYDNHRIVGSGPYGFRCLVGCSGTHGPEVNQLIHPWTMQFDRQGNMFVTDRNNNRVQKFLLSTNSCALSYNQPKFCSYPTWNSSGNTVLNYAVLPKHHKNTFIDNNNNLYVAGGNGSYYIHVWSLDKQRWTRSNISIGWSFGIGLFVTVNGDIYVGNNSHVIKWMFNDTTMPSTTVLSGECYDIFIDVNNNLYCSMQNQHKVVKKSLLSNLTEPITVAGKNGSPGAERHLLFYPYGIFVDIHLTLFVADHDNNRIQRFELNQLNGTTVAGNGSKNVTIILNGPTEIVLDADSNLFIVDFLYKRIVSSGPNGFRCIIGCNQNASASTRLYSPSTMYFDTYGNIFVVHGNDTVTQIQKFNLAANSCEDTTTTKYTSLSTTQIMSSQESSSVRTTAVLTTIIPTTEMTSLNIKYNDSVFLPGTCKNSSTIGSNCTVLNTKCQLLTPCQNNGTCKDTDDDYICVCSPHFTGIHCESDQRICKKYQCFNHGSCTETFNCQCDDGWQGEHCHLKVNYCENVICQNDGICESLVKNYTCHCLGDHYYGRHCENTTTRIRIYKIVSKSFAYVAIIALASVAMFILIMDILKYCFGIDPVEGERRRLRREIHVRKRKRPVIQRFVYVNAPPVDNKKTENQNNI